MTLLRTTFSSCPSGWPLGIKVSAQTPSLLNLRYIYIYLYLYTYIYMYIIFYTHTRTRTHTHTHLDHCQASPPGTSLSSEPLELSEDLGQGVACHGNTMEISREFLIGGELLEWFLDGFGWAFRCFEMGF